MQLPRPPWKIGLLGISRLNFSYFPPRYVHSFGPFLNLIVMYWSLLEVGYSEVPPKSLEVSWSSGSYISNSHSLIEYN